ncbi:tyrosine-protein kinase family protein [Bacillus sp. SG-1]|uniref:tyrosine-protein kinase family protein n=1 Tax=Bacillus sp. SG-1 TaxID=161544 RepID=UPI00015440DC|nr:ParA family protein [Bacillus sp. SG-1]EDL65727.1 hypothetical protein BSG1_12671 [Bacillus sp. SG-1]
MTVHFDEVLMLLKDKMLVLKNYSGYNFFIVRDVFGRISVYIEGEQVDNNLIDFVRNILKDTLGMGWVHNIEKVESNSNLLVQLNKSCDLIEDTSNIYFGERHLTRLNWFSKEKGKFIRSDLSSKVVTFYSYKGGLGRTTSLVLTALQLVRAGKKVVVVDFDLEAPGLSSLLIPDNNQYSNYGLVDYLLESPIYNNVENKLDIDEYVYPILNKELTGSAGGKLYVVPAANANEDNSDSYLEKMGRIDFNTPNYSNENNPISKLLSQLNERYKPDFIFLDSRTGIHEVGGLTLTQFTDISFLLFYGNKQNMSGMKMVLPKVIEANIPFFLINSPVPNSEEEATEVKEYYLEQAHNLLCEVDYYKDGDIPDLYEENADHYPYMVNYQMPAVILNSNKKIISLLENDGNANIYLKFAEQIASYNVERSNPITNGKKESVNKFEFLRAIEQIMPGKLASSEHEFHEDKDLEKKFYPLKEHRFIFEPDKFLILGAKGSGKSALFSVLEHANFAKSLASFYDLSMESIENMEWIPGLKISGDYPSSNSFDLLSEHNDFIYYKSYWRLLAIRYICKHLKDLSIEKDLFEAINDDSKIRELAKDRSLSEDIEKYLKTIDKYLDETNQKVTVVYDALDVLLGKEYRGKMISALISLWYEYLPRYKNIRVKIFLRDDIFEKEVSDIPDKVKLRNYSEKLSWTYDELLAMIWKRIASNSEEVAQHFHSTFNRMGILLRYEKFLGYIPKSEEEVNKVILKLIVGERMGTGKAAYSYNWIRNHLADTNERILPRSIIKLFAEAAVKELELNEMYPYSTSIIRPRSLNEVMKEVSIDRVKDLLEEYKEYENLFNNLKDYLPKFPAYEEDLKQSLKLCGVQEGKEVSTIQDLVNIGVMKPYQRKKSDPIRYHIPDIFLIGLGLSRVGLRAIN